MREAINVERSEIRPADSARREIIKVPRKISL
jgi:hypothetical protein